MISPAHLVRLYPQPWRERYGDEFAMLLEEMGAGPGAILDVLSGALDAHIRQRASDRAAARAQRALRIGGNLTMGTLFGLLLATFIWLAAIVIEGGDVTRFLMPVPWIMVVGGTLCALLIAYPARAVGALLGLTLDAFRGPLSPDALQVARVEARYRLGARMFGDAARFALMSGLVAGLTGVALALISESTASPLARSVGVSLTAIVAGLMVALFCLALAANLRHKGDRELGTLRALDSLASSGRHAEPRPVQGAVAAGA